MIKIHNNYKFNAKQQNSLDIFFAHTQYGIICVGSWCGRHWKLCLIDPTATLVYMMYVQFEYAVVRCFIGIINFEYLLSIESTL